MLLASGFSLLAAASGQKAAKNLAELKYASVYNNIFAGHDTKELIEHKTSHTHI